MERRFVSFRDATIKNTMVSEEKAVVKKGKDKIKKEDEDVDKSENSIG